MNFRQDVAYTLLVAVALGGGCANPKASAPPDRGIATAQRTTPAPATGNLNVSPDIAQACNLVIGNVDQAPKFAFDHSALLPEDRSVLDQVAKCVTNGPLKGRAIRLVGRADPRGEAEYNFVLGENRADTVRQYLVRLGVDDRRVADTSRGKLDATGRDEDGWRRDRRVDLTLQ